MIFGIGRDCNMKFVDFVRSIVVLNALMSIVNFALGNEIACICGLLMSITIFLGLIEEKLSNGN